MSIYHSAARGHGSCIGCNILIFWGIVSPFSQCLGLLVFRPVFDFYTLKFCYGEIKVILTI